MHGDPARSTAVRHVSRALIAYLAIAGVLAWCQRGQINADFVAYATIAQSPGSTVNGYWSPLFSWLMCPLLHAGIDDLVAGRTVLLLAGAGYVIAVLALAQNLAPEAPRERALVLGVMHVVAVVQGALWANYLLDPDVLANALLFACLALLSSPRFSVVHALGTGAAAGLAYLAKAFMLPFLAVFLPVAVWLRRRIHSPTASASTPSTWQILAGIALGVLLTAGPWIAVLSTHYERFTFCTSGPANHANLGPEVYRQDLLWKPPLEVNYILEPHFGPDWSPLSSARNLLHQLLLFGKNLVKAAGHLAGPLLALALAMFLRRRAAPPTAAIDDARRLRSRIWLLLMPVAICLCGYCLVYVERRYVVPTLAPLLVLAAGLVASPLALRSARSPALLGALVAMPFALQELRLLYVTAVQHPQSSPIRRSQHFADEIRLAGLAGKSFAASEWHAGLTVAFAGGAVARYWGTPHSATTEQRTCELDASGADFYLRFIDPEQGPEQGVVEASWQCAHRGDGYELYTPKASRHR